MTRTSRQLTAGVFVTFGLAGFGRTALAGQEPLAITLRVRNSAQVPDDVVTRAQAEVTRIYRQAGVETVWLPPLSPSADTDTGCRPRFTIVILSRALTELLNLSQDAVGVAPGTEAQRGHLAYVFYDRVESLSGGSGVDRAHVLGHAIAHEIGHLFLPYNTHSNTGLMRADWTRADLKLAQRDLLLFTSEQAELIRSNVSSTIRSHECHIIVGD